MTMNEIAFDVTIANREEIKLIAEVTGMSEDEIVRLAFKKMVG